MCIPRRKKRYYFKREMGVKNEGGGEVQLITTEQMFKLCVGSSVSSLSPSGVKLQRLACLNETESTGCS